MPYYIMFTFGDGANLETSFQFLPRPQMETMETSPNGNKNINRVLAK